MGDPIIHADYTHSLLGALVLSALIGAFAWWRWGRRIGLLVGGVAFSHWILDLIMHRADMPLLPGNLGDLPLLGFGLWRVPVASIALEAVILLVGVFLYWRTARSLPSQPGEGSRPRWSVQSCWVAASSCSCWTPSVSEILRTVWDQRASNRDRTPGRVRPAGHRPGRHRHAFKLVGK